MGQRKSVACGLFSMDSRGFVMKIIDWFRNGSQEEIKADCRAGLQNVIDVCNTIGVYVTMDYEGSYLK